MRLARQVREVVEYAAQRFITVVPEIELPGHCRAALACYAHLSCAPPRLPLLLPGALMVYKSSCLCTPSCHGPLARSLSCNSPACCRRPVVGDALRSSDLPSQAAHPDKHLGWRCAGLDDAQMETVPTRWGVHADVYCAVRALSPVRGCSFVCAWSRTGARAPSAAPLSVWVGARSRAALSQAMKPYLGGSGQGGGVPLPGDRAAGGVAALPQLVHPHRRRRGALHVTPAAQQTAAQHAVLTRFRLVSTSGEMVAWRAPFAPRIAGRSARCAELCTCTM